MEWLLVIPVVAAAIGLYVWFRPDANATAWTEDAPEPEHAANAAPVPRAERERERTTAAVAVLHAAERENSPAALAGKPVRWR